MQTLRPAMRKVPKVTDEQVVQALWSAYQRYDKRAVTRQLLEHSLQLRGANRMSRRGKNG
jgi:hypothetical protein